MTGTASQRSRPLTTAQPQPSTSAASAITHAAQAQPITQDTRRRRGRARGGRSPGVGVPGTHACTSDAVLTKCCPKPSWHISGPISQKILAPETRLASQPRSRHLAGFLTGFGTGVSFCHHGGGLKRGLFRVQKGARHLPLKPQNLSIVRKRWRGQPPLGLFNP